MEFMESMWDIGTCKDNMEMLKVTIAIIKEESNLLEEKRCARTYGSTNHKMFQKEFQPAGGAASKY